MFEGSTTSNECLWQPLAAVDRECFGCGTENSHGLQMCFESNGEMIRSKVIMEPRFRGWGSLIHGGILSTMLDETMGWTAVCLTGRFVLTRTMQVAFRRPVRIGAVLTVTAYIQEQVRDKRALVVAEIHDETGDLCASSEGGFALFSKKQFLRMQIVPEEDIATMEAVIASPIFSLSMSSIMAK